VTLQELAGALRNDKEYRALIDAHSDEDGDLIPTDSAWESVEEECPNHSDAEKWRLAIAATLIELYTRLTKERQARSN
jgi:hypothetical protein